MWTGPAPLTLQAMPILCRNCLTTYDAGTRCTACRSPRKIAHPELFDLTIAHMDCDAFYASVEKRDNPDLADKPVIIGGGRRGVVSTACYVARIKGVKSAMPMFQALKLCPEAVVVSPRMDAYVEASKAIRAMMDDLTPNVEPLSLDEAFMDMTGTARLHGAPPAVMLARLIKRMKDEVGLSGSIGLSHNKFLAKVASDLDKPRGFSVIGKTETTEFLRPKPIRLIWGIGPVAQESLGKAGIRTFDDLLRWDRRDLHDRFVTWANGFMALCAVKTHDKSLPTTPSKASPMKRPSTMTPTTPTFLMGTSGAWPKRLARGPRPKTSQAVLSR